MKWIGLGIIAIAMAQSGNPVTFVVLPFIAMFMMASE